MIVISLQRDKCIGCNYCVEVAPMLFQMSKKDGKTVLLRSSERKGFFTVKTADYSLLHFCEQAEKVCPVHIIEVKDI